jgi:hypothetical protein
MTLRVPAAIAVGLSLIILPVIIVRAQAEGETEAPPAAETVADPAPDTTAAEQTAEEPETTTPAEQEGSVLGAETSTETGSSSETGETDASATTSDAGSGGEESGASANTEAASTTAQEFPDLGTASSTASSTEPVADPPAEEPKEEPFVLQAAVTLHVEGSSISADIQLENLTCKVCEKVLPAAQVKAYYTAWYPNDGPDLKEVGERFGEQAIEVSDVVLWASRSMSWSAADIAPGRYYFVVVVDPENAIGAYRMQRMEFAI